MNSETFTTSSHARNNSSTTTISQCSNGHLLTILLISSKCSWYWYSRIDPCCLTFPHQLVTPWQNGQLSGHWWFFGIWSIVRLGKSNSMGLCWWTWETPSYTVFKIYCHWMCFDFLPVLSMTLFLFTTGSHSQYLSPWIFIPPLSLLHTPYWVRAFIRWAQQVSSTPPPILVPGHLYPIVGIHINLLSVATRGFSTSICHHGWI